MGCFCTKHNSVQTWKACAVLQEMFFAGLETASSTVERVMAELLRHLKSMKGVREELNRVAGPRQQRWVKRHWSITILQLSDEGNTKITSCYSKHKAAYSNLPVEKTQLLVKRHVFAYWEASSVSFGFSGCIDLWVLPCCQLAFFSMRVNYTF